MDISANVHAGEHFQEHHWDDPNMLAMRFELCVRRAESKAIATNLAAANVYMKGTVSSMMGGGADSTLLSPDAG